MGALPPRRYPQPPRGPLPPLTPPPGGLPPLPPSLRSVAPLKGAGIRNYLLLTRFWSPQSFWAAATLKIIKNPARAVQKSIFLVKTSFWAARHVKLLFPTVFLSWRAAQRDCTDPLTPIPTVFLNYSPCLVLIPYSLLELHVTFSGLENSTHPESS